MQCENGRNRLWMVVLVVAMILAAAPAAAQSCDDPAVTLTYDHIQAKSKENDKLSFDRVQVAPGDEILVKILNTCPASFKYAYEGVRSAAAPPPGFETETTTCQIGNATVCIRHEERFGSYLVHIEHKPNTVRKAKLDGKEKNLPDATLVIPVVNNPWKLDFSSGFAISELTDPIFTGLEMEEDGQEVTRVFRDRSAEDDANLGIAAFTHVTQSGWGKPSRGYGALSFGLGIDERNKASYFVGLSWLFGDKGALTAGYQWGSVDRLPAGLAVGDVLDDANALNDLPDRIDDAFFVSLGFSFLGGRDHFETVVGNAGKPSGPSTKSKTGNGQ